MMQMNELVKVFNLSKKFYMMKNRRLPKLVKVKIEKALASHLKKKIALVENITD